MSLALPGLVLVAALCHASWNTVARHHAGHLGVLWLGALLGWVAITPIARGSGIALTAVGGIWLLDEQLSVSGIPASLPSALVFCRARQVANNHRHVTRWTGDLQLVGDGSVPRSRVSDVARGTYWLCWAWITGARTGGSPAIHSAPSPASSSRVW